MPPTEGAAPPTDDRATAARLSTWQAGVLGGLGVPIAVPGRLPAGWRVDTVEVQAGSFPDYTIRYDGPDGACLAVVGATEGLGDRFVLAPPHERLVDVPGLATSGPVRLGWSDVASPDDGWDAPRVHTEWFGIDGVAYAVDSPTAGCARADVDDVAAFVASMRTLDANDDGPTGVWALVDVTGIAGERPEAVARSVAGPDQEGGRTTVEILNPWREVHLVALVTRTGLADDSVRDERWRIAMVRSGRTWDVVAVGQQVRCQAGRGATDWTDALCL